MNNYLELIRQAVLISSISPVEIDQSLREGTFRTTSYDRNNIVHFAGEVCSSLEIVLMGKVMVERIDESGNLMTIAEFSNNDILGGNLLFSKNPYYPMTITAKQPTITLVIGKSRLFQLFSDNHEFLKNYLEFVSDNATILGDRIKHYVNRTIRDSVINYLKCERNKQKSDRIHLDMTKKALAERIGVQRTSLSRELGKMREEGLVRFDSRSIELLAVESNLFGP